MSTYTHSTDYTTTSVSRLPSSTTVTSSYPTTSVSHLVSSNTGAVTTSGNSYTSNGYSTVTSSVPRLLYPVAVAADRSYTTVETRPTTTATSTTTRYISPSRTSYTAATTQHEPLVRTYTSTDASTVSPLAVTSTSTYRRPSPTPLSTVALQTKSVPVTTTTTLPTEYAAVTRVAHSSQPRTWVSPPRTSTSDVVVHRNAVVDAEKDELIARHKREITVLQEQLAGVRVQYESRISALESDLTQRGGTVDAALTSERLIRKEQEILRLEEALRSEKKARLDTVGDLETKLSKAQHERRVTEELVGPLKTQNNELSEALRVAKTTRVSLEERLGKVPADYDQKLKLALKDKDAMETELPNLRKQVIDLKAEREILDKRVSTLDASNKRLQGEYDQTRIKYEQDVSMALTQRRITEETVDPLNRELLRLKTALSASERTVEELTQVKAAHETRIRELQSGQERLRQETLRMNGVVEEAKRDRLTATQEVSSTTARVGRVQTGYEQRIHDLENDLTMAIHEKRMMETETQEARAELARWHSQRASLEHRAADAENAQQRAQAALEAAQQRERFASVNQAPRVVVESPSPSVDHVALHTLQQQKSQLEAEVRRYHDVEASRRVLHQRCENQEQQLALLQRQLEDARRMGVTTTTQQAPLMTSSSHSITRSPERVSIVTSSTRYVESEKKDYSHCSSPFVGFGLIENATEDATRNGLEVETIYREGPAWQSGLRLGDRVQHIIPRSRENAPEPERITSLEQVRRILTQEVKVGETVRVVATRKNTDESARMDIPVKTSDERYRNESAVFCDVAQHEKLNISGQVKN